MDKVMLGGIGQGQWLSLEPPGRYRNWRKCTEQILTDALKENIVRNDLKTLKQKSVIMLMEGGLV